MARGGYRPGSGPQKGTKYRPRGSEKEQKPRGNKGIPPDVLRDSAAAKMTPLDYVLSVMNDPLVDEARRDRLAVAALPFCHPRKGEGAGKKEDKVDRAKQAGAGKFAPSKPPLALVK